MASATDPSPVWALLNSLKSRGAAPAASDRSSTTLRAAEGRRAAVDAVCAALDTATANPAPGALDADKLFELAVGSKRAPAATAFVKQCKAGDIDMKRLRTAADDARGDLIVAGAAHRRAREAADDIGKKLDALER